MVDDVTDLSGMDPSSFNITAEKTLAEINKAYEELKALSEEFDKDDRRGYFPPIAIDNINRSRKAVGNALRSAKQVVSLHNYILNLLLNPLQSTLTTYSSVLKKDIEDGRQNVQNSIESLTNFTREKTDETTKLVNEMAAKTSDETVNSLTAVEELATRTINLNKELLDSMTDLSGKSRALSEETLTEMRDMVRQYKMQGKESMAELKKMSRDAKKEVGKMGVLTAAIAVVCVMAGWYGGSSYESTARNARGENPIVEEQLEKDVKPARHDKKQSSKEKLEGQKLAKAGKKDPN